MKYRVIAECVDARTGSRYFPGDPFEPAPDPDQAARLVAAGCLEEDRAEDGAKIDPKPKAAPKRAAR